jgi:7-methyl-GTP pyrophosphatase
MTRLVLASTSRYKRALLARLSIPFDTIAPPVDETPETAESPRDLALRLARLKAESVARDDAVVIGADQVASLDGRLIGKPLTHEAAVAQLASFQGMTVRFHTAACVLDKAPDRAWNHVDTTTVRFRRRPIAELDRYLTLEPAYDCAGGFKAEGLGIALFEAIESVDPTALIGLPLIWLAGALSEAGFDPLRSDGPLSRADPESV